MKNIAIVLLLLYSSGYSQGSNYLPTESGYLNVNYETFLEHYEEYLTTTLNVLKSNNVIGKNEKDFPYNITYKTPPLTKSPYESKYDFDNRKMRAKENTASQIQTKLRRYYKYAVIGYKVRIPVDNVEYKPDENERHGAVIYDQSQAGATSRMGLPEKYDARIVVHDGDNSSSIYVDTDGISFSVSTYMSSQKAQAIDILNNKGTLEIYFAFTVKSYLPSILITEVKWLY